MPKVKSSLNKSSKKLISTKRFNFSRVQVLTLLLMLSVVGVAVVLQTFAASAWKFYYYNSPGIGHVGGGGAGVYKTDFYGTVITWNSYDIISEGYYTWFGPYVNISGNHTLQTCWWYLSPKHNNATMLFDVIYTNYHDYIVNGRVIVPKGHHLIWSSGNRNIPPSATLTGNIYVTQMFCHTTQLGNGLGGTYPHVEIRTKTIDVDNDGGDEDAFKLWRTSWRYL